MRIEPSRAFTTALGMLLLLGALAPGLALAAAPPAASAGKEGARPQRRAARLDPPTARSRRPGLWYQRNWGVDLLGVRPVSSGLMLRFDYRVVEPTRAAVFADPAARPYLIDEATRTALAVPAMENVGELRQKPGREAGRTYYMIFGNPGRLVKRGSRVTLVMGNFRAEGLVVR